MKKLKITLSVVLIMSALCSFSQGVSINDNGDSPDPSAILDVKSTTLGMLVPRMTAEQAFEIDSPAEGLLIYCTDCESFLYYRNTKWNYLTSDFAVEIDDADFDTKVTTGIEDDDIIRFHLGDAQNESFRMVGNRIEPAASNIFIGESAGLYANLGEHSIGIGRLALKNNNQTGIVAIGDSALFWNYDTGDPVFYQGEENTAIGYKALRDNYTGSFNTALGFEALKRNTNGYANTAVGSKALSKNNSANFYTECINNTAIGSEAMLNNTTGSYNTAIGSEAMLNNTSGSYNTGIGARVFLQAFNGDNNNAFGCAALAYNQGDDNCAFGYYAALNNNNGSANVAMGSYALLSNSSGSNNVAIGDSALTTNEVSDNTALGAKSLCLNTSGFWNTAVGSESLYSNSTGYFNTAVGNSALVSNDEGHSNTATGVEALYDNTDGYYNTANGFQALYKNTLGDLNVAVGASALRECLDGSNSVAIGFNALYNNESSENVAVGSEAAWQNLAGTGLTVMGTQAAYTNSSGSQNTAIGYQSLYANNGNYNTAIGYQSLISNTGARNIGVGSNAGSSVTSGQYNTIIGSYANMTTGTYSNSAALGDASSITADNQVRLGDVSVNSIGGYANWTNISDGRFKSNVNQDVPGLEFIRLLKPVTYNLNIEGINDYLGIDNTEKAAVLHASGKSSMRFSGFVAQDVEEAAHAVNYEFSGVDAPKNKNDLYGLRYAEFVVPLVKAVQELEEVNQSQNAIIQAMQEENKILKQRIEKLELLKFDE